MFTYDRHRAQRVVVKLAVQVTKIMADRRWERDWGMISRVIKGGFWKEVKLVRKGEQAKDEMVNDDNGQILRDGWCTVKKEMVRVF